MNVTVENLAPCKKLVRIELNAQAVDAAFAAMEKNFQKEAQLPGFRPGRAPIPMVVRKYETEIQAEVKRKLIGEAYRDALKEQNIDVLGYPDIEEIQFGRGQSLLFAATIETPPEFQLPEYKGLPVKREAKEVSEADVVKALDLLREQRADFVKADRALASGHIAVVNYVGTSDGRALTEIAPAATRLAAQQGFWIEMKAGSFLPGFSEQLLEARAGDKRTVTVDFPADFNPKELAGRKGVYEVEVVEVREKTLPPLDDAFAKLYDAENLDKLREGVRKDLENELKHKLQRDVRGQLVKALLERVNFDLPEGAVANETRNVVYNLVRENAQRGVPRDLIEKEKNAIYNVANQNAKERVKFAFLVQKIAEKEEIKVSQEEVARRIHTLAAMYQIPAEKFVQDLQKRNGLIEIYDQLASERVLEFLEQHAAVETVPAKA
ncbi:MAG TPA: trigger factor [Verrucomicrobiota bacterium]|nr:trigger factor [Verrucomicrobiota bacterium]HNT14104.1 trigger factor [Verrucomicrobiota bacterium]